MMKVFWMGVAIFLLAVAFVVYQVTNRARRQRRLIVVERRIHWLRLKEEREGGLCYDDREDLADCEHELEDLR